jgi:hypothetical protein
MAPKHGPRPGYATYKRRVLRGIPDQPRCKAVRTQPPRKGDPCQRPAMKGSEFCANHAPERQEHRAAHLERVRSRKSPVPMVPMAPLVEWLHRRHAELGTWAAVGFRVGLDKALVHRYALGLDGHRQPKHEIGEDTVRRMLDTDGSAEFADLYPTERIAA